MARLLIFFALLLSCLNAGAGNFPRPASLEPAVQFWIKVYTRITTNQGYVHDAVDLSVVYETMDLPAYASNTERGRLVTNAKFRVVKALNALGAKPMDLVSILQAMKAMGHLGFARSARGLDAPQQSLLKLKR